MGKLADWFMGRQPEPEARSVDLPWMADAYVPFNYGGESLANVSQSMALSLSSVYAANRLIASSIATLPVKAYRRVGDERQPMSTLPQLFERLVSDGEIVPWLHRCVTSMGLRGNAYGYVVSRDGFGFPTQIEWLSPSDVMPDERPGSNGAWLWQGRVIPREDVVHIPWFAVAGKRCGLSPIGAFAATLGIGLQAQSYASDWFRGGGFPPGTFKNVEQEVVDQETADAIRARLTAAIKTRTPLVHGRDWEFTPISVPPEEAQFVETMKMTTNQVAAVYGIPPEMIGGESGSSMTYANVEQQQINFVMLCLRPWLVTLETAFSAVLPDRQYVKLNADALIRADLRTRWDVNKIRLETGAANLDEIRAQEDEPPLPNGQGQKYGPAEPTAPDQTGDSPTGNVVPMRRDAP